MWKNNQIIVDTALKLTGVTEFESDSSWNITPPNWACPVCKRSKLHITRVVKRGVLQGHMHNHHDHIYDYALETADNILKEKTYVTKNIQMSADLLKIIFMPI